MSSPDSLPPSNRDAPKPDRPLLLRLYASPHLVELVRLFGDREISKSAAQEELQPLLEKFGKPRIQAATDEMLIGRDGDGTTWFRLTDDVRRLAAPLLGSQPVAAFETAAEPPRITSSTAEVIVSSHPQEQEFQASSSGSASVDHDRPAPAAEQEPDGFRNFESFLLHYWLTGEPELCNSLIDAACDDLENSPKVIDEGWSVHDAAIHYMAEELRDFAEQEAFARSNADPETTRMMLERIEWREIASALLSYE